MTTRNSEGTGLSSCVGEGSDNPALWDPVQCRFLQEIKEECIHEM